MKSYYDVVQDSTGKPLSGATVTVYSPPGQTSTKATLYSDDGITTTANPVTTDQFGRFHFYVADGRYDLAAAFTNGSYTQSDVEIADVTQASSSDSVWTVQSAGLKIAGATSGAVTLAVPAIAGSTSLTLGVTGNGTAVPTFPAATDTVVELTQTQTLTNKNFTGASSNNSITLLNLQVAVAPITGNAADQVYYTYTLPANVLQAGKGLRITAVNVHTTGTASVNFKLSFGGTFTTTFGIEASSNATGRLVYEIFNNPGVTNAQTIITHSENSGNATVALSSDTAAVSTTSSVVINLTFNVANTDAITPKIFFVELIQ